MIMQSQNAFEIPFNANSGMYAESDYNVLNKLYLGIVANSKKDIQTK